MTPNNNNMDVAEDAYNNNAFIYAFVNYLAVATDSSQPKAFRAKAWAMMGRLVGVEPDLSVGDSDTGIFYYLKALEIDPCCFDAHAGIVLEYGDKNGRHNDAKRFELSVDFLKNDMGNLSDDIRNNIISKIRAYA